MILNTLSSGEGPPLVLLHGLFGAAKNLGLLSRGLSPYARVIAMDLRNHGYSPHAPDMSFPTLAEDVANTIESLNLGPVRLAGHSLGGKTAMVLALTRPELVSHLAVLDIAPIPYDHDYDDYVAAMQAIPLGHALTRQAADAALAGAVKAAPMRAFLLNNLILGEHPHWRIGLEEIAAAMPQMLAWTDPPGVRPYTGPTLFLRGAESHYVQPSATPAILRLFPNAVQQSVPGASHWLHADRPQDVIAITKDFFFP